MQGVRELSDVAASAGGGGWWGVGWGGEEGGVREGDWLLEIGDWGCEPAGRLRVVDPIDGSDGDWVCQRSTWLIEVDPRAGVGLRPASSMAISSLNRTVVGAVAKRSTWLG